MPKRAVIWSKNQAGDVESPNSDFWLGPLQGTYDTTLRYAAEDFQEVGDDWTVEGDHAVGERAVTQKFDSVDILQGDAQPTLKRLLTFGKMLRERSDLVRVKGKIQFPSDWWRTAGYAPLKWDESHFMCEEWLRLPGDLVYSQAEKKKISDTLNIMMAHIRNGTHPTLRAKTVVALSPAKHAEKERRAMQKLLDKAPRTK